MKKYIILSLIISITSLIAQTNLVNEKIEKNKLTLSFKSSLSYSLEKNNSKRFVFTVPNYQDEAFPGDVRLPSNEIFISLPNIEIPRMKFTIIKKKDIVAIPEFNNNVKLTVEDEVVYSEAEVIKNSKNTHLKVKGYLWIENKYCLHLEVIPAIFISSKNIIELVTHFEVELLFNTTISLTKNLNINNKSTNIISNKTYNVKNVVDKFKIESDDSWIDYTKQYLKIGTAEDGIYRIFKSDLDGNVITNPKTFKMFLNGKEIPIWVHGEDDLSFDENDYIEFVGIRNLGGKHRELNEYDKPYNEYLGRYSDTTIYWLTWDGDIGERVQISANEFLGTLDTLDYYTQIDHYEKNIWFGFSCASLVRRELPFWNENKTWHEGTLNVGVKNKSFMVLDFLPDTKFSMFVKLQDKASNISTKSHQFTLGLNSTDIWSDSSYVNKYETVILNTELNTDQLFAGNNTLKISSIPTEATLNACRLDWYEIEYFRHLIPIDNKLNFIFPFLEDRIEKYIKLQDVSSDNFSIWKYGETYKKYNATRVNNEIMFRDTISSNDKYLYVDETKILTAKIYYSKQFEKLRSSENKADYIAITHKKFKTRVDDYARFISDNYNVETIVVDVDDIYDEYSYGFFNPEIIKDFLKSTHNNWQSPKPKNVVLIGGATYDYYGNRYNASDAIKERAVNYVPSFGASVSDNWFVNWDTTGAYIPQMNIGRIPVTTNEELDWYFEKHQNYVSQEYDDWNKRYLFFSSGSEKDENQLNLLRSSNEFVIENYAKVSPIGGKVDHFYKTLNPNSNFGPYSEEYFNNSISDGAVLISYIGHSGTQTWDNSIISQSQLMNDRGRYPLVSDFGCSTGRFGEPDVTSFSQLFTLEKDGQALAYIGNSSLGFVSTSVTMPKLFYKKILSEGIYNVSEAHKQAKMEMLLDNGSTGVYELFSLTNSLIGDPILTLSIPSKPNFKLKSENIYVNDVSLNDAIDSLLLKIVYYNLGSVIDDSLTINIKDEYNEHIDFEVEVKRKIPKLTDTLSINVPIKNKPGKHTLRINLDAINKIEEISEVDNLIDYNIIIASSSTRTILSYKSENTVDSTMLVLNPTTRSNSENLIYEVSNNSNFSQPIINNIMLDTFATKIDLHNLETNKRYWLRTKLDDENNYGVTKSFYKNADSKYLIADSLSFLNTEMENLVWDNDVKFGNDDISLTVFSAGFLDGNTALIKRKEVNYIPESTIVGHHVSLFENSSPYEFVSYNYFNTFSGGTAVLDQYKIFLDSLTSEYLIFIAVSDDGRINDADLREKLKGIGSLYIDSLNFRSSWAIIGYKGAIPGTVPEGFSNATEGPVEIDTTFQQQFTNGTLITSVIGPAKNWENITVGQSISNGTSISYFPIGIDENGEQDTLNEASILDDNGDLSYVNDKKYKYIKLKVSYHSDSFDKSPVLNSLGVNYIGIPELGTNYQVVSIEQDSVEQGEYANLSFYVYNVGESTADSFKVQVEVINPDNSREKIFEQLVDSLGSEQRSLFNVAYNTTSFNGERTFSISIDSENKILELYEDNNFYTIPFYVIGDTTNPSMNITFDGNDIFEGEYISASPKIKIEMSEPSLVPITDTNSVSIFLNNERVNYKVNEENLIINYSQSNPKVVVDYTPQLDDGEYELRVFGKDASGNVVDSSGIEKSFIVQSDAKIMEVYNYPNPFADETYFTFKLTQIPDEVKIRIFTIAGRLIKEIILSGSELNYDLNKIYWDGIDTDGDEIGNGVYIYKVIMDVDGEKQVETKKLAVVK